MRSEKATRKRLHQNEHPSNSKQGRLIHRFLSSQAIDYQAVTNTPLFGVTQDPINAEEGRPPCLT